MSKIKNFPIEKNENLWPATDKPRGPLSTDLRMHQDIAVEDVADRYGRIRRDRERGKPTRALTKLTRTALVSAGIAASSVGIATAMGDAQKPVEHSPAAQIDYVKEGVQPELATSKSQAEDSNQTVGSEK